MYFALGGVSDLLSAFCSALRFEYHSFSARTPVGLPPAELLLVTPLLSRAKGFPLSLSETGESPLLGLLPSPSSESPGERGVSGSPQVPWGRAMYLREERH